ncbi:helix-turn-helix domain-containing protein [Mucilaginibacter sp. P25]|uniref:HTH-type transcriptional regulator / antitoxin HigA n=1 Tax=Mucilaginibacter gossypii TaxID=551996 RepID=A0A1G8JAY2_9SPHI|nr:helix-turn-helix transcriptional regulator [Mucilaginibacter gossypii]SDI28252.1 HTH-type transcriptional regulator / antitoxin HigA [Mucilaginibacter gossypii]
MIKNQKQAALTKEKLKVLEKDRIAFMADAKNKTSAELILGLNSFDALIDDMKAELHEFDELTKGNLHIISAKCLDDIHKLLIGARIAQKITHRELADRIGIQEQQIQRYEATDYESANLARLREVALALQIRCYFEKIIFISIEPEFNLPDHITPENVAITEDQIRERGALLCIE